MATTLEPPATRGPGPDRRPDGHGRPGDGGAASEHPPAGPRGSLPAGKVLAIALIGLLLGALLNADSLVEQAERKPFGWPRDVSLAIWEPLATVSHALALDRPRIWLDDALGRTDDDLGAEMVFPPATEPTTGSGTDAAAPGSDTATDPGTGTDETPVATTPTTVPAPELRTPSAAEPLRLWVGGDSMSQVFGESLVRMATDTGVMEPTLDYRISTGLTRPDYFNWPAHLVAELDRLDPEAVVIMFGANDAQGIVTDEGDVFQPLEEGWITEYRRRVAGTMDLLRDDDRVVWWVGQPIMRSGSFSERMAGLNAIYREEAASRPWIEFVDTFPMFSGPSGGYEAFLPGVDGTVADLRQGDGIHLSRAGGDLLARDVLDQIEADADITG
ncbi:MAG TPA: DUF459 domain-containing protein [Acidimicrobiales bacterium]|nr:DUF459 domain-containing protein [Acidimicrobiales bacterium]